MKDGLTQMALEDLYEWLRRHEDAHIVTDVKAQNLVALWVIAKTAGSLKETVTMPWEWALSLPQELRKRGVFVYAHTVNSLDVWRELQGVGVSGIYTDFLTPAEIARVAAVER